MRVFTDQDVQRIKMRIGFLFSLDDELQDQFETVADYFEYLASSIAHRKGHVSADPELLSQFEAVFLTFRDSLSGGPEALRSQVDLLERDCSLCARFATLTVLTRDPESAYATFARHFLWTLTSIIPFSSSRQPPEVNLSSRVLLDLHVSLQRLAGLAKYAAGLERRWAARETKFDDLQDHYSPDLVDRSRLHALLAHARRQVADIPHPKYQSIIEQRLTSIETELKRGRATRWTLVIGAAFALFSFLADLEQLYPGSYSKICETAGAVLSVLHKDGQVQSTRLKLSMEPLNDSHDRNGRDDKEPPMVAIVDDKRRVDGDPQEATE